MVRCEILYANILYGVSDILVTRVHSKSTFVRGRIVIHVASIASTGKLFDCSHHLLLESTML